MKKGFTLAEVLITLGIIGVVAALTMPSLIAKQQEKQTITALKKSYNTLNNAFTMTVTENGTPDNWDLGVYNNLEGSVKTLKYLSKYIKLTKNCGGDTGCFPDTKYPNLDGSDYASSNLNADMKTAKAILSDGTLISISIINEQRPGQWIYGQIQVDVNGFKGPNQWGYDAFIFNILKDKIEPTGYPNTASPFDTHCYQYGWGCAAWVITNENLDYIRCNDLSWDGKIKCK